MEHLTDAMRAAAATPPPTAIDLEQLIADERRNSRLRRWGAGVGAVVAVLLIVGGVAFLPGLTRSNGDGGLRAGDPGSETKTEPVPPQPPASAAQREEATRLLQVLADALVAVAGPASGWTVDGTMWEAQTGLTGNGAPLPGYTGSGHRVDGNSLDKVYVLARRAPMPPDTTCVKDAAYDVDCTVEMRADGSQLWRTTMTGGNQFTRVVEVYRPDGTHIMVGDTAVGGSEPVLSTDQLIAIADTPALAPTVL